MVISMSQPEHFPYLGYFQKMKNCDLFVILDDVKFGGPKSFQNRNRFTQDGVEHWFTVPVSKGSSQLKINQVRACEDVHWRKKILRMMKQKFGLNLEDTYHFDKLIDINMDAINLCRDALNIDTQLVFSSSLPVSGAKAELVYNISKYLGARAFLSGPGARKYFDLYDFKDLRIEYTTPILNFESSITFINDSEKIIDARRLISSY